jgi:hypothetical protein
MLPPLSTGLAVQGGINVDLAVLGYSQIVRNNSSFCVMATQVDLQKVNMP